MQACPELAGFSAWPCFVHKGWREDSLFQNALQSLKIWKRSSASLKRLAEQTAFDQTGDTTVGLCTYEGGGPKWNLLIKMCAFLRVHTSVCTSTFTVKVLSIQCSIPLETFSPLFKTVFELLDVDALECFCCFLSHLFHIDKMFPMGDFFMHRNKQTK